MFTAITAIIYYIIGSILGALVLWRDAFGVSRYAVYGDNTLVFVAIVYFYPVAIPILAIMSGTRWVRSFHVKNV